MNPAARLGLLTVLWAHGCGHHVAPFESWTPEATPLPAEDTVAPLPPPAGVLSGSLYHDVRDPVELTIPEGWVAELGPMNGAFRLALTHVATDTRLELWSFAEVPAQLHRRAGCLWTFRHEGTFETIRIPGPVEVATCIPINEDDRLILATIAVWQGRAYHFETLVPPGRLAEAKRATDEVLATVRFR